MRAFDILVLAFKEQPRRRKVKASAQTREPDPLDGPDVCRMAQIAGQADDAPCAPCGDCYGIGQQSRNDNSGLGV